MIDLHINYIRFKINSFKKLQAIIVISIFAFENNIQIKLKRKFMYYTFNEGELGPKAVGTLYQFTGEQIKSLKTLKGNRPVEEKRKKSLLKSFKKNKYLESKPIIINEKKEVIDGEGRRTAAIDMLVKEPNFAIYALAIQGATLKDAQIFNSKPSKEWSIDHHINSNVELEITEFIKLRDFIKENNLPTYTALMLLRFNGTKRVGAAATKKIREEGENLIISDERYELAKNDLKDLEMLRDFGSYKSANFVEAYFQVRERKIRGKKPFTREAFLLGWNDKGGGWMNAFSNGKGGFFNKKEDLVKAMENVLSKGYKSQKSESPQLEEAY